jgi:hypothetical protein
MSDAMEMCLRPGQGNLSGRGVAIRKAACALSALAALWLAWTLHGTHDVPLTYRLTVAVPVFFTVLMFLQAREKT